MKSRGEILQAHYRELLRRGATWAGLIAMTVMTFGAGPANAAGQLTARSTLLGSSAAGASTTYTFTFTPASTYTVKAIKLEVCNSPLETTTCTASNSSSVSAATLTTGAPTSASFSGWLRGTGAGGHAPAPTATAVYFDDSTGFSLSASKTIQIAGVVNPNVVNTEFYTRITTYTVQDASSGEQDYGAEAVSTSDQVTVNANVQESLTLCVYLSTCGGGGGTLFLAPAPDHVLSASAMTGGVSKIDASTNAASGYVITYMTSNTGGTAYNCSGVTGASSGSLGSSADCIPDAGGSAVGPPAAGTGLFGINLKANSTTLTPSGALGSNVTGSGTGTPSAPYATADQVAFQAGATPRTIASAAGPTVTNTFTVTYAAQAGSINKPGTYTTTFTYVCTGTF